MPIKPNQVVTVIYSLKDQNGEILDSATKEQPFSFLSGQNQILPKLEEEIGNMLIGSRKEIFLSPEEAYGEYQPESVQVVDRSNFPEGSKLEEGMEYVANTPDGQQLPFVIAKIEGDEITLDFNHPLAGEALTFDLELLDVREATAEELAHGHVHGDGGHHH
ncbi:MAG: peptidylprolyl isomerase [Ignavibacteria bacterium]|jgi:FKBP-type peptidyl-prolyl cis-trans isomerase SlyD|nr:peptidylprolyl isomerase [Ignavibacteria bacterium]MCU7503686.1 peptidylprolyl isomerase [Ignavibacteria bacterium]MCU7517667.1 peptidylprolyl isomerase [Ignavibacteria bacterium]